MLFAGLIICLIASIFRYGYILQNKMTSCSRGIHDYPAATACSPDVKISSKSLPNAVSISQVNMSRIKTGKISAIRFQLLTRYAGHSTANRAMYWNIYPTMKPISFWTLKTNSHN